MLPPPPCCERHALSYRQGQVYRPAGYTALTPRLRDLLLRHPHLAAFTVAVRWTGGETERFTVDAAQVLALAQAPDVVALDIVEDVVVPD